MIVDGRIGLLQYDAFDRFETGGVRLKDGTLREAELVVVATGYENLQETVRAFLGDAVADRIGPVWGFDAGGELANMFKPTPQSRPMVHRRQPRPVPHLLPLPRPADQGAEEEGHSCLTPLATRTMVPGVCGGGKQCHRQHGGGSQL